MPCRIVADPYPPYRPVSSTRSVPAAITCGSCQAIAFPGISRILSTSPRVVMIARSPLSRSKPAAETIASCIRSTARRVTQSNFRPSVSARLLCTLQPRPKVLTTSLRKAAFLFCDSARKTRISGRQRAIGTPGNPAPEPRSNKWPIAGGSERAVIMHSRKCRRNIPSSSRMAVRFVRAFQRTRRSKNLPNWRAESSGRPC